MGSPGAKVIGFWLRPEDEAKLELIRQATGRSRSDVIRQLLRQATVGMPDIQVGSIAPAPDHAA
jgi:Ribbon-helix-helix protein, copG family